MHNKEKATAACPAAMAQTDALSWQPAHDVFRLAGSGAQSAADKLRAHARAKPKQYLLDTAFVLASAGLRPVPMLGSSKRPARKGWRELASLDCNAIAAAFSDAPYADAIGVATGEGMFVIDLDRNHKDGADGIALFADLTARHADRDGLALGPRVRTPAGGVHLYFRSPPGVRVRNRAALVPGIDVRGEGGVAMVPPSARECVAYRWTCAPWECALPPAPAWLLDMVAPIQAPRAAAANIRPYRGEASAYARVALQRELGVVASAAPGTRNDALNRAAFALGGLSAAGALPVNVVACGLLEAAGRNGLIAEDGEAAVRATIASGLRAGRAKPRKLPPPKRCGHFSKGQKREARR